MGKIIFRLMEKILEKYKIKNIGFYGRLLMILTICFFCRKYIYLGIDKFIITPFAIDKVNSNRELDILSLILIVLFIAYVRNLIVIKKQRPTISSLINIFFAILFYLLLVRCTKIFFLEPVGLVPVIKYLDILFLFFLLLVSKFTYSNSKTNFKSVNGFIEDNFKPEGSEDLLGRNKYALEIGFKILDTLPLEKAFVIAINSPWGFGKSGFFILLENFFKSKTIIQFSTESQSLSQVHTEEQIKELYSSHQNTLIVRFNPWKTFDERKIIKDFFNELSGVINEFDTRLSKKIKTYSNYLYKLDESVFNKAVEVAVDMFDKEPTLTNLFDEINNSIGRIKKKLIVFIDDMDRLMGEELVDILKLIRNTANFRNTYFIVAYDHNYVLNTIDKQNLISNKEEFLQKIVQLELTLPVFQKNLLLQYMDVQISRSEILGPFSNDIKGAMNEISAITVFKGGEEPIGGYRGPELLDALFKPDDKEGSLIFKVLTNIRDVVRFLNSFKLSFEALGKFGDVYEVILLDFLKIKFLSIYQMLANKYFLTSKDNRYEFDKEEFGLYFTKEESCRIINIRSNDLPVIKKILEAIFNFPRKYTFRSIRFPRYFDIYFNYQASNLNSLLDIENALKNEEDTIKLIDELRRKGQLDDLRNFLENQSDFGTRENFESVFKAIFNMSKYDKNRESIYQVQNILRNKELLFKIYDGHEIEFTKFLLSVLGDKKYGLLIRTEIAGAELYSIINSVINEYTLLTDGKKPALQEILAGCLAELIRDKNHYDFEIQNLYIKNLESIEQGTRIFRMTKEANELMRNLVTKDAGHYLKRCFIRKHPEPSFEGKYYNFDPFIEYYFGEKLDAVMEFLTDAANKELFETDLEIRFYDYFIEKFKEVKNLKADKFLEIDKGNIEMIDHFIQPQ
jgi:hypothetical protein